MGAVYKARQRELDRIVALKILPPALGAPPGFAERYMASVQTARPDEVDHRADMYSLGVVLYEWLTGELPTTQLQPPSRKVRVDVRLDEIVLRALQERPERRNQTAVEFNTQLSEVATNLKR